MGTELEFEFEKLEFTPNPDGNFKNWPAFITETAARRKNKLNFDPMG